MTLGKVQLKLFPRRVKQHILAMNLKNPHFSYDNWAPTLFSTQYFWFILKVRWQRLEDKTEEGGLAPNCPVVRLSGQRCHIWDFMQGQEADIACLRGAWNGDAQGGWESPELLFYYFSCLFFLLLVHFLFPKARTSPGFCFSEWHQHLSLWAPKPQTNYTGLQLPSTALTIRSSCLRCISPPLCPVNSYASFCSVTLPAISQPQLPQTRLPLLVYLTS